MTIRQQQVESVLKRQISEVLARRLSDPRIAGMVSITRVEVSPDLALAKVYVSVIPDHYEKRTIAGLKHAARHIQRLVGDEVRLRQSPRLDFRLDESLKTQARVLDEIRKAVQDDQAMAQQRDEAAAAAAGDDDDGQGRHDDDDVVTGRGEDVEDAGS